MYSFAKPGTDNLIYNTLMSVLLLPRTLWQIVVHPAQAQQELYDELESSPAEQYRRLTSPFFLLFVSGPLAFVLPFVYFSQQLNSDSSVINAVLTLANGVPPVTLVKVFTLFCVPPLLFAIHLVRCRRQKLDRRTFKPILHGQCFLFGGFYALLFPKWWSTIATTVQNADPLAVQLAICGLVKWFFGLLVWLLLAEAVIMIQVLRIPWHKVLVLPMFAVGWYLGIILSLALMFHA